MLDSMIACLLETHMDTEEDLPSMIENHIKCLTGLDAESPLHLSALPLWSTNPHKETTMTTLDLEEVSVRLEESVKPLLAEGMTPSEIFDVYEQVAIQLLDSEYMNHPENLLEAHLLEFLSRLPRWPTPPRPGLTAGVFNYGLASILQPLNFNVIINPS
jgi:hypothetical protein